jgi:chemotaxis protein MotA
MAHLAKTVEGMPQITSSLNVAFDTTLVALLIGLILNFFYHRYLEELDTFYSRARSYIIDNLISRIYKA